MFNKNSKFGLVESDDEELSIKPSKKKKRERLLQRRTVMKMSLKEWRKSGKKT